MLTVTKRNVDLETCVCQGRRIFRTIVDVRGDALCVALLAALSNQPPMTIMSLPPATRLPLHSRSSNLRSSSPSSSSSAFSVTPTASSCVALLLLGFQAEELIHNYPSTVEHRRSTVFQVVYPKHCKVTTSRAASDSNSTIDLL